MFEKDVTDQIIRAFYKVYNTLGYGFLEKVYENALMRELRDMGVSVVAQQMVEGFYKGERVGMYFADLIVQGKVIVELKAAAELAQEHEIQLVNYLKATEIEVGLLLNFGETPQLRRKLFTNNLKQLPTHTNKPSDTSDHSEYFL